MFWVEYIIVNSVIQAKECHIQVSPLPNTHVVVKFAIKLKIPHWRIVTIEIDTKYSFLFQNNSNAKCRLISIDININKFTKRLCWKILFISSSEYVYSKTFFCFFNEKDIIKGTRGWLYLDSLIANVKFLL